jgi:hypothetical protein
MNSPALPPKTAVLKLWMTFSALLYAGSGLVFAVAPGFVGDIVRFSTRLVGLPDTPPSTERFWLTLSVSMMVMLVVCCAMVARDVVTNMSFCVPVIFSKFTSTFLGVLYFVLAEHHGAVLVIGATDLPLGIVTWVLWNQARREA